MFPWQLQGSLGVFLCNVKASKMRGVVSQARLLFCSASDVSDELLAPPAGAAPGDRITFLNYPGKYSDHVHVIRTVSIRIHPKVQASHVCYR